MTPPLRLTRALQGYEASPPEWLGLAEACSLAVRVTPALLRTHRLALRLAVAAEQALWTSPLVESSGLAGLSLHPEATAWLRARLTARPTDLAAAWQRQREVHRDPWIPPIVQAEEELTWLSLHDPPDLAAISALLGRVLAALDGPRRAGTLAWARRALPRLPPPVRRTPEAWMLALATGVSSGRRLVDGDPPPSLTALPANLLVGLGPRSVGIRFRGATLELTDGAPGVEVPDTRPAVVFVGAGAEVSAIALEPGQTRSLPWDGADVELGGLDGRRWRARPGAGSESAPSLAGWIDNHRDLRQSLGEKAVHTLVDAITRGCEAGAILLLSGPEGSGRTTLLANAARELIRRGLTVQLRGPADASGGISNGDTGVAIFDDLDARLWDGEFGAYGDVMGWSRPGRVAVGTHDPSPPSVRRRFSKVDPWAFLLGAESDGAIARRAGVDAATVRAYRTRDIPPPDAAPNGEPGLPPGTWWRGEPADEAWLPDYADDLRRSRGAQVLRMADLGMAPPPPRVPDELVFKLADLLARLWVAREALPGRAFVVNEAQLDALLPWLHEVDGALRLLPRLRRPLLHQLDAALRPGWQARAHRELFRALADPAADLSPQRTRHAAFHAIAAGGPLSDDPADPLPWMLDLSWVRAHIAAGRRQAARRELQIAVAQHQASGRTSADLPVAQAVIGALEHSAEELGHDGSRVASALHTDLVADQGLPDAEVRSALRYPPLAPGLRALEGPWRHPWASRRPFDRNADLVPTWSGSFVHVVSGYATGSPEPWLVAIAPDGLPRLFDTRKPDERAIVSGPAKPRQVTAGFQPGTFWMADASNVFWWNPDQRSHTGLGGLSPTLALAPSGDLGLLVGQAAEVLVLQADAGSIHIIRRHPAPAAVTWLAGTREGPALAACGRTICAIPSDDGQPLVPLGEAQDQPIALLPSSDPLHFVSIHADGSLAVWHPERPAPLHRHDGLGQVPLAWDVHGGGRDLLTITLGFRDGTSARLLLVEAGFVVQPGLPSGGPGITAILPGPGMTLLGTSTGELRWFATETNPSTAIRGPRGVGRVTHLVKVDERMAAVAWADGTLAWLSLGSRELRPIPTMPTSPVQHGTSLMYGDGTSWEGPPSRHPWTFEPHPEALARLLHTARETHREPIRATILLADGEHLVSASEDRSASLVHLATGALRGRFHASAPIRALRLEQDGRTVRAADALGNVWHLDTPGARSPGGWSLPEGSSEPLRQQLRRWGLLADDGAALPVDRIDGLEEAGDDERRLSTLGPAIERALEPAEPPPRQQQSAKRPSFKGQRKA